MKEEQNKYEFTGETMEFEGHTLQRIRYICDFGITTKGELGGWIEHEGNLSHEGSCSIRGDAKVFGHARITESATVSSNAIVKDNVYMKGNSYVSGNAIIGGDTILDDDAWILGNSKVFFYAKGHDENCNKSLSELLYKVICEDAYEGKPNIYGDSTIFGETIIEATGYIRDSEINDISLDGHLVVEHEVLGKPSTSSFFTKD